MGWDGTAVNSKISTKDYLNFEYSRYDGWEVVASGQGERRGGNSVWYHAIKKSDGRVFAIITLTNRKNGWVYKKSMGEDEGPYSFDCPAKVFNALTPTTSEFANEWRAKVAERLANPKPKVKVGDTLKFKKPIEFVNGFSGDTFVYYGGSKFRSQSGGGYRITNWKLNEYEILTQEEASYV